MGFIINCMFMCLQYFDAVGGASGWVRYKAVIVSIVLSHVGDLRVGAHLHLHSSVMWVVGHTSPTYCRYLPDV